VKRALISIVAGAALLVSSAAYAASTPLAPGGAAGIKQAQDWTRIPVWGYVGGVLVIVGFIAVLTDNGNGSAVGSTCALPGGGTAPGCIPAPPTSGPSTSGH
jgi:hypothetical protein